MVDFSIQSASVQDAHVLSLVGSATFLESFANTLAGDHIAMHCHRAHSVKAYSAALRDGAEAWLARLGKTDAPVGYAMVTAPDLPITLHDDDLELKRIYLLSRYQGLGVGKALMDAAIDAARNRDAGRLLLGVYRDNREAIGFYEALGFVPAGTRRFQVGDGIYDDLILALDLRGRAPRT